MIYLVPALRAQTASCTHDPTPGFPLRTPCVIERGPSGYRRWDLVARFRATDEPPIGVSLMARRGPHARDLVAIVSEAEPVLRPLRDLNAAGEFPAGQSTVPPAITPGCDVRACTAARPGRGCFLCGRERTVALHQHLDARPRRIICCGRNRQGGPGSRGAVPATHDVRAALRGGAQWLVQSIPL